MATKTKKSDVSVELIVRRGALRRFQKLKEKAASLPVKVTWDRRLGDRRVVSEAAGPDRRKADRRQAPPFTWDLSDFVVVPARQRKRK